MQVLFQPIQSILRGPTIHTSWKYRSFFIASHILTSLWLHVSRNRRIYIMLGFLIGNTFISINILSQFSVTVTSSVRFLYHTECMNSYPKDGQDWWHFGFKTHHIPISRIIPHTFNDFKSQDFNHYPLLNYTYIIYIFSTEIIIIFDCDGVVATQHLYFYSLLIIIISPWTYWWELSE